MLKNYDKKIILFPAGTSGQFLANFLSTTNETLRPNFRLDWGQVNQAIDFIGPRVFETFDEAQFLKTVDTWTQNNKTHTMISHYKGISNLLKYSAQCWVRKIVSGTYILNHCKNVFFKKQELEIISYQTSMPVLVDSMLMNIDDFYNQNKLDTDKPDGYIIDFHKIYNIDYLIELFQEVNAFTPTVDKINWANEYISKQFDLYEYPTSKDMGEIIQHINPTDAFDIAAALFAYENNWNTVDQNRLWTINSIPESISGAVDFLIDNSKNYKIFKD